MSYLPKVRPALLLWVILSASLHVQGQVKDCTRTITIVVKEQESGQPYAGSNFSLAQQQGFTDENGLALLSFPCTFKLTDNAVKVDGVVLKPQQIFHRGDTLLLTVPVYKNQLETINVTDQKRAIASYNAQSSLSSEEMLRFRGKSLAAMASNLAGVNMIQTGAEIAKPMINGMSNNRILILNNGVRQEGQQWGAEHAPEIDAMSVAQISVVKGAEAIRYGRDAIGGVLLVNPNPLPYHSEKPEIGLALIGNSNGRKGIADVRLGSALGKDKSWAWRAQSSLSRGGNYKTPEYFLDNTGNKSFNYSLGLGHKNDKHTIEGFFSSYNNEVGIFKGSHIGDTLDLQSRIRSGRPFEDGSFYYNIGAPRQWVQHQLFKLNAQFLLSDRWTLDALYSFQYDRRREFDIRRQDVSSLPSIDLKLAYQTLKVEAKYKKDNWTNIVGLEGDMYVNNNTPDLFTTPIIPNYDSKALGAFALSKLVRSKVGWELGLRYDYYNLNAAGYNSRNEYYGGEHTFSKLNASIGMSMDVFNGLQWFSNLGTAWRPPTVNELYSSGLHHGAAQYELGDSSLNAEQSVKWINSLKWESKHKQVQTQVDVYAQYFGNYIYLNPSLSYVQSLRGAFPVFNYKSTEAFFWGIDLHGKWNITDPLSYDLKASLIRAKDIGNNNFLPFIPSDRLSQTLSYGIKLSKNISNLGFWLRNDLVNRQSRYHANSDYAPPPDAYSLFALGMNSSLQLKGNIVNLNLSVENLFNTEYKDYLNRYRYYAHDIGRNISLKINYLF